MIKSFLILASAVLLGACARVGAAVVNIPAHFADHTIHEHIVFEPLYDLALDVYTPTGDVKKSRPVLVFLYGGGYSDGQKESYRFVAESFTKEGYVVVIPDYRKYPKVKFPCFVFDGAQAIAWTYKNIGQYGGDKDRIFVEGHSAGAHIGALVAANPIYLKTFDVDRSIIRGFAGLAGPYDFTPEEEKYKIIFGPPDNYPNMQVTTFIDGKQPPMLLLHGADDRLVYQSNLDKLAARIHEKGGSVETKIYPGLDHVEIIADLTWIAKKRTVREDMLAFFKKHDQDVP